MGPWTEVHGYPQAPLRGVTGALPQAGIRSRPWRSIKSVVTMGHRQAQAAPALQPPLIRPERESEVSTPDAAIDLPSARRIVLADGQIELHEARLAVFHQPRGLLR